MPALLLLALRHTRIAITDFAHQQIELIAMLFVREEPYRHLTAFKLL